MGYLFLTHSHMGFPWVSLSNRPTRGTLNKDTPKYVVVTLVLYQKGEKYDVTCSALFRPCQAACQHTLSQASLKEDAMLAQVVSGLQARARSSA